MPDADPVGAVEPRAPRGHLSRTARALAAASSIDDIATILLTELVELPGVRRVGFSLSEVGGRRLRFIASDRLINGMQWCHVDAYDDVPLTSVIRTGVPIWGPRGSMDRKYAGFMADQPSEIVALAAVPLPGIGSPIGGLILFLDEEWPFDAEQRDWLEATARCASDAVRRIRADSDLLHEDEPPPTDDLTLTARIVLADDPRAAKAGRRFLREFLARAEVPESVAEAAELCLSELVTNAIMHAGGRSELRATVEPTLVTVSVRDRGGLPMDAEPDSNPDPLRVDGRGLQLVAALADRWGSERDAVGTSVWFALELAGERTGAVG